MLNIDELDKINTYLCYLAVGMLGSNGLEKEETEEIMDLACRCLDMKDKLEKLQLSHKYL
jgi:hypothetical protein